MSKGTRVVPIRIPEPLFSARSTHRWPRASVGRRRGEPFTRSSWILNAVPAGAAALRRGQGASGRRREARDRERPPGSRPSQDPGLARPT